MNPIEEFFKQEQQDKLKRYRILNEQVRKGETLFTGSSLMEQFPVNELRMTAGIETIIYNRGIGGFTTDDMLESMEEQVFGVDPARIFINIGTNDLSDPTKTFDELLAHMLANYEQILTQMKERLPQTEVFLMAYYPVNETDIPPSTPWMADLFVNRNNRNLPIANAAVEKLAEKFGYHYIDVNDGLTDEKGMLCKEFTVEGVHMYANGYRVVFENLKKWL